MKPINFFCILFFIPFASNSQICDFSYATSFEGYDYFESSSGDRFGHQIALFQNQLVVAAPWSQEFAGIKGYLKAFDLTDPSIDPVNLIPNEVDNHTAYANLLGVYENKIATTLGGRAFAIFEFDGTDWNQSRYVETQSPIARLESSIDFYKDQIVIIDGRAKNAYLFSLEVDGVAEEIIPIDIPSEVETSLVFGLKCAMTDSHIYIADEDAIVNGIKSGVVMVMSKSGNSWESSYLIPEVPQESQKFGASIDVDANQLVVGSDNYSLGNTRPGAIYYYLQSNLNQETIILPEAPHESAGWGTSVMIDGDKMVTGAEFYRFDTENEGAVFYLENNQGWEMQTMLIAETPTSNDNTGKTVFFNNSWIIGASPDSKQVSTFEGTVSIFKSNMDNWEFDQTFLASTYPRFLKYGAELDIIEDQALVRATNDGVLGNGAYYFYENKNGNWDGQKIEDPEDLYVWGNDFDLSKDQFITTARIQTYNEQVVIINKKNGNQWEQEYINSSDPERFVSMGNHVSRYGDRFVASTNSNEYGSNSGSVLLFDWDGAQWNETVIVPPEGKASNFFGDDVILDYDLLFVGVPFDSIHENRSGSAYVYNFDGSQWNPTKIIPTVGSSNGYFGRFMDYSEGRWVVKSKDHLFLYENINGSWMEQLFQLDELFPQYTTSNDVKIEGNKIMLSSIGASIDGIDAGAIYLLEFDGSSWVPFEVADPFPEEDGEFGSKFNIGGGKMIVASAHNRNGLTKTGEIHIFEPNLDFEISCNDISLEINGPGSVTVPIEDLFSFPKSQCGNYTIEVGDNEFTSADFGTNSVLIKVSDEFGNIESCSAIVEIVVDQDNDGFTNDVDCDDNNAMVNPGMTEIPYNGLDDDCDQSTADDDLDDDGFLLAEDCDDSDATIYPNAPCNDGDLCTEDDQINSSCDCKGVFKDNDGDGVCNAEDCKPNNENIFPGAICNDNDDCTEDDIYDGDCFCIGVFKDDDGDGVCNTEDCSPNDGDIYHGAPCNDNDLCTEGDAYNEACECIGTFTDNDGDGVCNAEDCKPNNVNIYPGATCDDGDICTIDDIYDQDCLCLGTFRDNDGDGVCNAEDCQPNNPNVYAGAPCNDNDDCTIEDFYDTECNCAGVYVDSDNDGFCDPLDCDADDSDIYEGATCDDQDECTIDDVYNMNCNCEGTYKDNDNDGVCNAKDCEPNNPNIYPGAIEIPNNGIDENCDGVDDIIDLDGDGFDSNEDCDDNNAEVNPDAIEVEYNGIDDDCDPTTLDDDLDEDGYGISEDCNDEDDSINPGAEEIPDNDIDEDCDGIAQMTSALHNIGDYTVLVSPNPFVDFIKIETEEGLISSLKVLNTNGQVLFDQKWEPEVIYLNEIPCGLYLLILYDNEGKVMLIEKMIKQ